MGKSFAQLKTDDTIYLWDRTQLLSFLLSKDATLTKWYHAPDGSITYENVPSLSPNEKGYVTIETQPSTAPHGTFAISNPTVYNDACFYYGPLTDKHGDVIFEAVGTSIQAIQNLIPDFPINIGQ